MFKPVSVFVGWRYTRARKRNALISFVSVISMLGIALGVTAMIVVLSVINGSTSIMREETLKSVPHAVAVISDPAIDWNELAARVENNSEILAVAPFIEGEAWIRFQGQDRFIRLRGVVPALESLVAQGQGTDWSAAMERLAGVENGMLLGGRLAGDLGLYGDGSVSITPLGSLLGRRLSDARSFSAIGAVDLGFYGNQDIALINLDAARSLLGDSAPVQLRLRVADVFRADRIAEQAFSGYAVNQLRIQPWMETQAPLFDALRMEKILTGFMLLMIVIIGAVNIVSTLVMVVADKGSDIAILRTMGASKATVMLVFLVQGCVAGVLGTVTGVLIGVVAALNLSTLSRGFEGLVNRWLAPDSIYMISYLQAELQMKDVVLIALAALLISLLATLYPAFRASRVQPAEILRYE